MSYKLFYFVLFIWYFSFGCSQKYSQGNEVYDRHCSGCHGIEGEGLKKLYPPINEDNKLVTKELACIIRYGIPESHPMKSTKYNLPMPGNEALTDIDISNLINFIERKFYKNEEYRNLLEIKELLKACQE